MKDSSLFLHFMVKSRKTPIAAFFTSSELLRAPPCWWQKQVEIRDWVSPFCGRSSAVGLVLTLGGTSLNFPPGTCLRCHKIVPPGSQGRLGWQLIQKLLCYRSLCLHLIQDSDSSSSSTTLSSGCV